MWPSIAYVRVVVIARSNLGLNNALGRHLVSVLDFHSLLGDWLVQWCWHLETWLTDYAWSRAHVSCYLRQLLNWYSLDGINQSLLITDSSQSKLGLWWLDYHPLDIPWDVEEVGDAVKVRVLVHVFNLIKENVMLPEVICRLCQSEF